MGGTPVRKEAASEANERERAGGRRWRRLAGGDSLRTRVLLVWWTRLECGYLQP